MDLGLSYGKVLFSNLLRIILVSKQRMFCLIRRGLQCGSQTDTSGDSLDISGTPLDTSGALTDTFGAVTGTSGALLDISGALTDTSGGLLDISGALTETSGAPLDTSGASTNTSEALLESLGFLREAKGLLLRAPFRSSSRGEPGMVFFARAGVYFFSNGAAGAFSEQGTSCSKLESGLFKHNSAGSTSLLSLTAERNTIHALKWQINT